MKYYLNLFLIFFIYTANSQDNPCLAMLKDGLYRYTVKQNTANFQSDLKSYFESSTFRDDFKSGKWELGVSGVIPVSEGGPLPEIGLDFGASEDEINRFQETIRKSLRIEINKTFYYSSTTIVPDVQLAKAFVECIEAVTSGGHGFIVDKVINTPTSAVIKIKYRKNLNSDPTPIVKDIKILGATSISQTLQEGEELPDEFTLSCNKYPENETIFSINTDRESFVYVLEPSDSGFDKEVPIGTIITSVLPWNTFSNITEDTDSGEWDSKVSKWAPADGRVVASSKYQRRTGNNRVPDLRGVFIRGLNQFDPYYATNVNGRQKDPDNRSVGSLQEDAVIRHNHANGNHKMLIEKHPQGRGTTCCADGTVGEPNLEGDGTREIQPYGSANETRPVNRAFFHYIKIN